MSGKKKKFSELCTSIIKKISSLGHSSHYSYYTDLQQYVSINDLKTVEYLSLPNICTWDPLKTYPDLKCPHCLESNVSTSIVTTEKWETGETTSLCPRTLRSIDWYVALVGKKYKCKSPLKHEFVSYQAGILKQIPLSDQPFMLSHQFGITNGLYDFIIRQVEAGCHFETIETNLYSNFYDNLLRKLGNAHLEEKTNLFKLIYPNPLSNDSIHKIFLVNYEQNIKRYEKDFDEIRCRCLCIDHTFKAAANIGFSDKGKWIKLYDSLFIILNEVSFSTVGL